jgi:hypothetical protein
MVDKFLTMPYSFLFELQVLGFICNIYCIVLFILGFETPPRGCLWLIQWMWYWPITGYLHDVMPMMQRLHQCSTRRPMGSHPPLVVTHITHSLSHF